ncbi:MAG TPA: phosphatidate cytidylyltransferase [Chthonomonadaceae bacterium]|nr:phosphatidate cytidylyltransferase [Chthonomonadaceae bacterium]
MTNSRIARITRSIVHAKVGAVSSTETGPVRLSGTKAQAPARARGSLFKRILTTIVGVSYFLSLCFWGTLPFCIGVTVVAALGIFEFVDAYTSRAQADPPRQTALSPGNGGLINRLVAWLGLLLPWAAFVLPTTRSPITLAYAGVMAALVALFTWTLIRAARTGRALGRRRIFYGAVGCVYVGFLFSSFVLLRGIPGRIAVAPFGMAHTGAWIVLYAAACVWATDTLAYFVGRTCGRTPLAPTVSPGKTVEGAIGGLAGAAVVGVSFGVWIHLPWYHSLVVGIIAGLAGQLGDLFESALKREIGIKDFGQLMPGHGGMLDRADSLLFVMPLAYLYLRLCAGL